MAHSSSRSEETVEATAFRLWIKLKIVMGFSPGRE